MGLGDTLLEDIIMLSHFALGQKKVWTFALIYVIFAENLYKIDCKSMTATQVRLSIIELLNETPNVEILEIYRQMLLHLLRVQDLAVAAFDAQGNPMRREDLIKAVQEASERIEKGSFVSHQDVIAHSSSW